MPFLPKIFGYNKFNSEIFVFRKYYKHSLKEYLTNCLSVKKKCVIGLQLINII